MNDPESDEALVHIASAAFRLTVLDGPPLVLCFESLGWPSLSIRSRLELPYPAAGFAGSALSISAHESFAAAMLYSGQSEVGYEIFALKPTIQHLGGMPYVLGECDLSPPAFSPDERFVALAIERPFWWVAVDDPEPDWETPAAGGVVTWSLLNVYDLWRSAPTQYRLDVNLPTGWTPSGDGTWPRRLRFTTAKTLAVGVPWLGSDFEFELNLTRAHVVVPSPRSR